MIPKIIHYAWFGSEIPHYIDERINEWKRILPDWRFILWNENNFDINKYDFTRQMYNEKKLGYVADELRFDEIERDLPRKTKSIEMMLILHRSMYSIGAITKLIQNHVVSDYRTDYRRWLKYIRSNILKILLSNEVSMYRKGLLLGGCISPSVMEKLNEVRRRRISNASVDEQTLKNNNEMEKK